MPIDPDLVTAGQWRRPDGGDEARVNRQQDTRQLAPSTHTMFDGHAAEREHGTETGVMTTLRILQAAGQLLSEVFAFGLILLALLWSSQDASFPTWVGLVVAGAVYLVVGAAPFPWRRPVASLGLAAFLVPLVILGWISWRVEYFLLFEHVGAWQNLPRVLLGPDNLGAAALLSACAVCGRGLAAHMTARAPKPANGADKTVGRS